jgi:hypothetical protein
VDGRVQMTKIKRCRKRLKRNLIIKTKLIEDNKIESEPVVSCNIRIDRSNEIKERPLI